MKLCLLSIFLTTAILLIFSFSASAQQVNKSDAENSELEEAVSFLNQYADDLSGLKIYKLADTQPTDVFPQIADTVVKSGTADAARLQKIAEKVLQYHKLNDVCSVVLFNDDNPTVFTYRLRSISLSTGIFNILTDDEATALIAHEAGHLYFAKDLAKARTTADDRLARLVELKCDIISLITLRDLRIDPSVLIQALKKLIKAREKLSLRTITGQSPAMEDRISLTEIFLKRINCKKPNS